MNEHLTIALFSEIIAIDQRFRTRLGQHLSDDIELSHFSVLNYLEMVATDKSPAQIASALKVTRGAMTNTLNKLEQKGYIHIHKDWEDARRKHITISQSGRLARTIALSSVAPLFSDLENTIGEADIKTLTSLLRKVRLLLNDEL